MDMRNAERSISPTTEGPSAEESSAEQREPETTPKSPPPSTSKDNSQVN